MKLKPVVALGLAVVSVMLFASTALAADPFLCPVVGKGVLTAPGRADALITPPVGASFLPGKNQAGEKANPNAYNTSGPSDPNAGPGHNPDFSPIWPPS